MPATQPPTEPLTLRDFARALAVHELDIHFQPQVRFSDGALVRRRGLSALAACRGVVCSRPRSS